MSQGKRIPKEIAWRVADRLVYALAPACERLEIAGSIRRDRADVGDIELVAIPQWRDLPRPHSSAPSVQLNLFGEPVARQPSLFELPEASPVTRMSRLDERLDELVARDAISPALPAGWPSRAAWGPRLKRFWLRIDDEWGLMQVDLAITTPEAWGAILAIRTGPGEFSKALVTRLKHHTPYRMQDGQIVEQASGQAVPAHDELALFRLAQVAYITPSQRSLEMFRRAVARWESSVREDEQLRL